MLRLTHCKRAHYKTVFNVGVWTKSDSILTHYIIVIIFDLSPSTKMLLIKEVPNKSLWNWKMTEFYETMVWWLAYLAATLEVPGLDFHSDLVAHHHYECTSHSIDPGWSFVSSLIWSIVSHIDPSCLPKEKTQSLQ